MLPAGTGPASRDAEGPASDTARIERAGELAAELWREAAGLMTPAERRRQRRVAALVGDEASRSFLLELTDQVLRIRTPRRAADRLAALVAAYPSPEMAGPFDTAALGLGALLSPYLPGPVVALSRARLRRELSTLVLGADERSLSRHLRRRKKEHLSLNVNLLGEAVQGEGQAAERARMVAELLSRPEVDCVSVKLSSLYSQLDVYAYDKSIEAAVERLVPLLALAASGRPPKLVYVDMEEYRDLHLTVDAFTSALSDERCFALQAGVALQAYLPDSVGVLEELCHLARTRRDAGGAPLRVRLVKGANLAMERVEAELRGWTQAPYGTKAEVDANYKRLLEVALGEENRGAVVVGAASHNLFDVAWALLADETAPETRGRGGTAPETRSRADTGTGRVEIEMLEGMAPALARAVARRAGRVLLYAPVVAPGDFESAVAYLVRRFDENTAPENFLAQAASLAPGTKAWGDERARFEAAVRTRHHPSTAPRRRPTLSPGRRIPAGLGASSHAAARPARPGVAGAGVADAGFAHAPDTDWSLAENRAAMGAALAELSSSPIGPVAAWVDGEAVEAPLCGVGIDPSHPDAPLYRYVECDRATVERAVACARRAAKRWRGVPAPERRSLLFEVAAAMQQERARTIAVMVNDAGKVVGEADPEVSEAVDAARYYAERAEELERRPGCFVPHGVVVVAPPWNFPYAIVAGGTLAALAAGNAVVLKPAPETVLVAATFVAQCHRAGIPGTVLQFVPCADAATGRRLVTHDGVDAVVLTGAFETARRFLTWRPEMRLHAETSGKNALVVTGAADEEDAVRDLVHSAFSHSGQKCSAASLAIVEASVHDGPRFLTRLKDAVTSLRVGPAEDPATRLGPLIRPPQGPLLSALTTLSPGERWLVEPHQVGNNPHLWSPGIKLGVKAGSELHLTECFGPVLGVMRAEDLDGAIELQNAPAYGLTAGLSSLDQHDVARWSERVAAGNLYVNRPTTGAIVRRQPFGGWKRSAVGPGAKAGGPNYVASFGTWSAPETVDVEAEVARARAEADRLLRGVDPSGLLAEENRFRLRPLGRAALRLGTTVPTEGTSLGRALAVSLGVARLLGVDVDVSAAEGCPGLPEDAVVEDDAAFVARLRRDPPERVRLVRTPPALRLLLLDEGCEVDTEPLVAIGTYELLRWTREQVVSRTLHRHGNVLEARSVDAGRRAGPGGTGAVPLNDAATATGARPSSRPASDGSEGGRGVGRCPPPTARR